MLRLYTHPSLLESLWPGRLVSFQYRFLIHRTLWRARRLKPFSGTLQGVTLEAQVRMTLSSPHLAMFFWYMVAAYRGPTSPATLLPGGLGRGASWRGPEASSGAGYGVTDSDGLSVFSIFLFLVSDL